MGPLKRESNSIENVLCICSHAGKPLASTRGSKDSRVRRLGPKQLQGTNMRDSNSNNNEDSKST